MSGTKLSRKVGGRECYAGDREGGMEFKMRWLGNYSPSSFRSLSGPLLTECSQLSEAPQLPTNLASLTLLDPVKLYYHHPPITLRGRSRIESWLLMK